MDNNVVMQEICQAMRDCGEIILNADRSPSMIEEKGHANFVTKYDKLVQKELEKRLPQIVPGAVFVGEEEELHASIEKGYAFIVDPIDGTTNFIKDYKCSAISVGLTLDGEQYMGAVYDPYLNEMYTAVKGEGAFLNGKPIHVSDCPLNEGIVLFGSALYYDELKEKTYKMLYEYAKIAYDIRRSASAALDLCHIAAGRAELYYELRLQPWDYAAGSLIAKEAGAVVTTVEGGPITLDRPCSILCTNGKE